MHQRYISDFRNECHNHSTDHSMDQQSEISSDESFQIVQKIHRNKTVIIEEGFKKKKTELCRNYQIYGACKFGEKCFFAHKTSELISRFFPSNQQKTKPCKRYFAGICMYGEKCQFLHYECVDLEDQREFIEKTFKEQKLMVPLHPNKLDPNLRFDLQRFHHLYKIFGRKLNFKRDELIINSCRNRSSYFVRICNKQNNFEQLLWSNGTSRKESEN